MSDSLNKFIFQVIGDIRMGHQKNIFYLFTEDNIMLSIKCSQNIVCSLSPKNRKQNGIFFEIFVKSHNITGKVN